MSVTFRSRGIIKEGLNSDIVTTTQKNIDNWQQKGNVTIYYNEFLNTISFINKGKYLAPDGNYYKYYYYNQGSDWEVKAYSNYKFGIINNNCYFLRNNVDLANPSTKPYDRYPFGSNVMWIAAYRNGSITEVSWIFYSGDTTTNVETISGSEEDLKTYLRNEDPDVEYAELPFSVTDNKKYLLSFDACSTSGFDSSSNQVIIISGNNSVSKTLDNSQSSNMKNYSIIFEADGNSATLKFDFSKIAKSDGSQITLKISNISLYELGD